MARLKKTYFVASVKKAVLIIPKKWIRVKNVKPTVKSVDDLIFKGVLDGQREKHINAAEMRQRAVKFGGSLGLAEALRILEQCTRLSKELRSKNILFPGTVMLNLDSQQLVMPCLRFEKGRWILGFRCLYYFINADDRLGCHK